MSEISMSAAACVAIMHNEMRTLTADELNDLVAAYPPPAEAVKAMGIGLGKVPILFHEVDVGWLVGVLGAWQRSPGMPWPVFYMPVDLMADWNKGPAAQELLRWVHSHGLDVQLTLSGPATWLRGHWVTLCDIRFRFSEGADVVPLVAYARALIEQASADGS